MTLQIVVDMNLSPGWVPLLNEAGIPAVHWSTVGDPRALDAEIMKWAADNNHAVFTLDLDFSAILALTHENGPSVIQFRADDVLPGAESGPIIAAIKRHETELLAGALVVIEPERSRVRILPF
jgi:predicted nuclease of predicted toxin-antitoxin system